jgi:ABC-type transporter Mla MlaB component
MNRIEQIQEAGKITIRVTGELDSATALLARERIIPALGSGRVDVDLAQAQPVHDSALAILAELMRAAGSAQLSLRGLGAHQERILNYMGVNASDFRTPAPRHAMNRMGLVFASRPGLSPRFPA